MGRHCFRLQLRYSPVKSVVFCICLFNMMLCFKGIESGQMRTERTLGNYGHPICNRRASQKWFLEWILEVIC